MSSLAQILKKRRQADENPSLYSTNEHPTSLRIEAAGGSVWILPWHHFIFGVHEDEGDRERLSLTFVAHEVVLRGANLGTLVKETASQRLDRLCEAPGKYIRSSGKDPFIEKIEVCLLAEPTVG